MAQEFPFLSCLIWVPIAFAVILLFLTHQKHESWLRPIGLFSTLLSIAICIPLIKGFDLQTAEMQWQEHVNWLPSLGIYYSLGIDGFSLPLIILTAFMTFLVVLASYVSVKKQVAQYLSAFLLMQGLMNGAFVALDAILFYTFWEGMLIPMFLIIGIWGGKNRIYATIKFFLYTFLGSVLFLVGLIYCHMHAKSTGVPIEESFSILAFQNLPLSLEAQKWLFIGFLIAFAVKIPMWPVHTWLPDAHVEAPTGGSVILAAILLKMGGYGMLRFLLPILPDASLAFAKPMISLSLIAIIYIALVAIVQKDMKKLIAYSSVSHMGFVTLGMFVVFGMVANAQTTSQAAMGIEGAMVQMISHGFVSAALFLCVGVLYDRMHTRLIRDYGGIVNTMPIFASYFVLFAMANVGLPGTSGFVGEWMIILSAFKAEAWYAILAAFTLFLGASYTLWMIKRVVFGSISGRSVGELTDLKQPEKMVMGLLAISVLWLGLWPAPLLNLMHTSANHLVEQMMHSKTG